jgi:hypothetical protein
MTKGTPLFSQTSLPQATRPPAYSSSEIAAWQLPKQTCSGFESIIFTPPLAKPS